VKLFFDQNLAPRLVRDLSRRSLFGVILVGASALVVGDAAAQTTRLFCSAPVTEGARVSGYLVSIEGEDSTRRGMQLKNTEGDFSCSTMAGEDGGFDFGLVRPGRYAVTLGTLGIEPVAPIIFDVDSQSVRLSIPIVRENRIADCFRNPRCAPVLGRLTSYELSDNAVEQVVEVLGLRLAIALAGGLWADEPTWAACSTASEEVRVALQEVFARIEPGDGCESAPSTPAQPFGVGGWVRVIGTDIPGAFVRAFGVERLDADHYVVHVSYTKGGLWGEGHRCEVRRVGDHWSPIACRMTWVS